MPKVSVIVAAYNVEEYIEECLHTLINQTLEDVEFIVVDDGSTDNTGEIIKQWAELDSRIKLVTHEKNKGLMLARKTGYDVATGEYLMFLDGDDSLNFKACEKAYKGIKKENVDILQFNAKVFGDEDIIAKRQQEINSLYSYIAPLGCKLLASGKAGLLGAKYSDGIIGFTVWNKIYKREIVSHVSEHIPDEHIIISEDILFSYFAFFHAKSYNCIEDSLYNYRFGNGISTTQKISRNKASSVAKSYFVYSFLENWSKKAGIEKNCKKILTKIKSDTLASIGNSFLTQIEKGDRELFVNKVLEYCPIDEFISMISYQVHCAGTTSRENLAEICNNLSIFKTPKKQIKTIATFYHRMYNGGVENVISQLTDIWIKHGYNVVLFTEQPPNDDDYYINPKINRVILPEYVYGNYDTFYDRTKTFREALKKYNVDVMVYHAWLYHYLITDALITKSTGAPVIIHTHGAFCTDFACPDSYGALTNVLAHKTYRLASNIVALNQADEAYWASFRLNCMKTINPIAFPLGTKVSCLNGKNIMMACRISREKQVLDALQIINKVVKKVSDATLTIVGGGEDVQYMNMVKEYIKDNALEDVVDMVGFKKNVIPYYQSADIMLFTSKFEGAPLALMESKICGLPLVTYELLNVDTVRDAKGMAVVPQNDIDAAAEKIIEILSDDKLKKQMGKEARESAEEILSIDLAKHWDYIFEKTLNPDTAEIKKTPEQSAINTLVHYTGQGILARMYTQPQIQYQQVPLEVPNKDWLRQSHYAETLEATIKEIRSSTSYKLGWFLTTIPRKIKDFIKGQKYVE